MGLTIRGWKPSAIFVAAVMLFASFIPLLSNNIASAYGQITTRSIQMSSSASGATDVTYKVTFDALTLTSIAGVVIDFCANSPLIEASCTAPGVGNALEGFDPNTTGLALANQTGVGANNFAVDNSGTADDTGHTIVLTRTDSDVTNPVSFDLGSTGGSDGITNPSTTNETFYARIITFDTAAGAQGYTSGDLDAGDPNSDVDAGGVAISTAEQIIVTAKVPERLVFCVYVDADGAPAPDNNCDTKTGSAISLGDDDGSLHTTGEFINKEAYFSISTNAGGCAGGDDCTVINIKGDTLTSGSNTIDAIGTEAISAINQEQFGFCIYESGGTGLTADVAYDGASGAPAGECAGLTHNSGSSTTGQAPDGTTLFAFDTTATTSTYGDAIATKDSGDYSTANLAFVGNIGAATEAGIYQSTLTFIATGTY